MDKVVTDGVDGDLSIWYTMFNWKKEAKRESGLALLNTSLKFNLRILIIDWHV